MREHTNSNVVDPRLMTADEVLDGVPITGRGTFHQEKIGVIAGRNVRKRRLPGHGVLLTIGHGPEVSVTGWPLVRLPLCPGRRDDHRRTRPVCARRSALSSRLRESEFGPKRRTWTS